MKRKANGLVYALLLVMSTALLLDVKAPLYQLIVGAAFFLLVLGRLHRVPRGSSKRKRLWWFLMGYLVVMLPSVLAAAYTLATGQRQLECGPFDLDFLYFGSDVGVILVALGYAWGEKTNLEEPENLK